METQDSTLSTSRSVNSSKSTATLSPAEKTPEEQRAALEQRAPALMDRPDVTPAQQEEPVWVPKNIDTLAPHDDRSLLESFSLSGVWRKIKEVVSSIFIGVGYVSVSIIFIHFMSDGLFFELFSRVMLIFFNEFIEGIPTILSYVLGYCILTALFMGALSLLDVGGVSILARFSRLAGALLGLACGTVALYFAAPFIGWILSAGSAFGPDEIGVPAPYR